MRYERLERRCIKRLYTIEYFFLHRGILFYIIKGILFLHWRALQLYVFIYLFPDCANTQIKKVFMHSGRARRGICRVEKIIQIYYNGTSKKDHLLNILLEYILLYTKCFQSQSYYLWPTSSKGSKTRMKIVTNKILKFILQVTMSVCMSGLYVIACIPWGLSSNLSLWMGNNQIGNNKWWIIPNCKW